jgi:hypothetical protein
MNTGDLFFLTQAYERYVFERNPNLRVSLVNRMARLEEIIDWDSDKGKRIKAERLKTGKWENLPVEDNKYVFSVYYHDLMGRNGKKGVVQRGVCLFSKDPKTEEPFFEKIPDWLYREITKKCETFTIEDRDVS